VKVGLCDRYNLSDTSRMNREIHVRICEGLGVKFPWSTRLFCFRGKQKLYLYRAVLRSVPSKWWQHQG
jgi:hypothetical protein